MVAARRAAFRGALLFAYAAAGFGAAAETTATTEISAFVRAVGTGQGSDAAVFALSEAKLTFNSRGASDTKGQVQLDFKAGDTVLLSLSKAWIKARLDAVRLTAGKTRLSWGEGALFNAGNVIFGSTSVDLSAEDLRDDNAWLAAATVPFGDFSFLELVVLPPDPPIAAILAKSANPAAADPVFGGWERVSAGGRLYTKLSGVKVEAGYLWAGESDEASAAHKPYLSLQGHLLADWHLSASARGAPDGSAVEDSAVSFGLYRQWSVPASFSAGSGDASAGTLAARFEALYRPEGSWTATDARTDASLSSFLTGTAVDSPYALLVYPELSWRTNSAYLFLRALVSPVDASARTALAFQWAPLQGFKLLGSVSAQAGGAEDLFGWDRLGSWQAALGARLTF